MTLHSWLAQHLALWLVCLVWLFYAVIQSPLLKPSSVMRPVLTRSWDGSLVTSCACLTPALGSCANCPLIMLKVSLSQCQFELSCDKTNHLIFNVYKTSNNPNIRAAYLISVFTLGLNSLFSVQGPCVTISDIGLGPSTRLTQTLHSSEARSIFGFIAHSLWLEIKPSHRANTSQQIMKILHHCE